MQEFRSVAKSKQAPDPSTASKPPFTGDFRWFPVIIGSQVFKVEAASVSSDMPRESRTVASAGT